MKTIKLLLTCIFVLVSASIDAQDSYRAAVEAYAKANPKLQSFSGEKMKPALMMVNSQLLNGKSLENADELTERYLKEQMYDDVIDMILPVMKEHVTESELKELTSIMSTPEGISFTTNNMKWENAMESSLVEMMVKAVQTIQNGETPEPIKVASNIKKAYEKKFRSFMEATRQIDMFKSGLGIGSQGMLPEAVTDWIMTNVPNFMINSSYGIFSVADLDFGIKLGSNDSYQKAMKAALYMTENAQSIGMTLINGYVSWLKAQGASINDL